MNASLPRRKAEDCVHAPHGECGRVHQRHVRCFPSNRIATARSTLLCDQTTSPPHHLKSVDAVCNKRFVCEHSNRPGRSGTALVPYQLRVGANSSFEANLKLLLKFSLKKLEKLENLVRPEPVDSISTS